jgi:hypothetical protein
MMLSSAWSGEGQNEKKDEVFTLHVFTLHVFIGIVGITSSGYGQGS